MSKKTLFFLLIILVIAVFFRLWKLNEIPPGLYPDVAINGNEALESLKTGNFKLFYPENNGREGLMMWLIALSFSIFGISIWSIKIVAAIIGILTVLGIYLLTKELFNRSTSQPANQQTIIAFLSSFLLATSFWHTNFSRIGFRAILLPFILVFSFYFLLRGFRTTLLRQGFGGQGKIRDFIISGIFFGFGFYTYISFRFAVLMLPFVLIPYWLIYKRERLQKKFLLSTFYLLLTIFIVALPIGIYFLKHPQDFIGRAAPISVFATQNPIKELVKSLILHLAMFNFYGDSNWRHNFAGSPMLPWLLGILFLIGLILSFKEIFKKSNYQNKNYQLLSTYYFLLATFFTMLLPGILTYEGIPHSLRVIGVIPVVYIFVSIGGLKIYQFFNQNTDRKKLLIITSILFLIAIGFSEFNKYFFEWGKNKEVEGAFTERFVKEANFLNSLPENVQKYVIVNESGVPVPWPNGIPMPAQTIMFIENIKYGKIQSTYLLPENLDKIKIDDKGTVILPMKYDQGLFNEFSRKFPGGKIEEKDGFSVYKVNF
jgi:4-amino-4-deoxy-L-arabinose transferase-like glycosyltransferase